MIPDPFHPLVVHFPIVLAALLPLASLAVIAVLARRRAAAKAWIAVVALQLMLVGSGWLALETGENEEDRVETVVSESFIEEHEENAERFMILAWIGLPIAALGLLGGGAGTFARASMLVASLATLAAVGVTGHTGGQLVYRHGAPLAYLDETVVGESPVLARLQANVGAARHGDEDDDD